MRCLVLCILVVATSALAQQPLNPSRTGNGATYLSDISNLPIEKIGRDDLVGITVYDSPELTRTVRVGSDGNLRLPMLKQRVHAEGLYPVELESAITQALVEENVLVDPIVTVSVVEYRSRPITVSGAVKRPVTFQASGVVTLLDAISQAEGLTENAGAEILVSKQISAGPDTPSITQTQRISVQALISGNDPALNLNLNGGEDIRVPEAGRVFVVGNVKRPGSFLITDGSESSVLKALALSQGLDNFTGHTAYIYRADGDNGTRREIPIELKKIMDRKNPDVPLIASDLLYIPEAKGMRAGLRVLQTSLGIGTGLGSALIIYNSR